MGLIPAPDLEFVLDRLENEGQALCLMATDISWHDATEEADEQGCDPTDFTPYIDPVSIVMFLDLSFSLSLESLFPP